MMSRMSAPRIPPMKAGIALNRIALVFNVTEFLTVAVSLFRLAFRLKIRRFWWEDLWAAVVMAGGTAFAVADLVYFRTRTFEATRVSNLITFYLFTSIIWSVRMSLLYSLVRIIPPCTFLHNLARAIGAIFIIVWASLIALKAWWCTSHLKSTLHRPVCLVSNPIAIFELVADVAGDATLVVFSFRLFWRVKLPRRQRRMILLIFSSGAIMSMLSLPHAAVQLVQEAHTGYIIGSLELIASLVVCNLLVIVTYMYRVFVSSSESETSSEDDDFTTPMPRSTQSLTTVDLDTPDLATTGANSLF